MENGSWHGAGEGANVMQHRLSDLPDTLTVPEVMKVLRLGRNSVYDGIRRGEIPSVRIGRRLLVPKVSIERLLNGALG